MNLRILASASVVALLLSGSVFAQNPLEGVWEHTSRPGTLAIYTSDVYAVITLPPGRPKVEKPFSELTEQELRARYAGISPLQYGTYTVRGDRLTRHVLAALDPGREGTQVVYEFRIEGDTLTIVSPRDTTPKVELRFRRVRKGGFDPKGQGVAEGSQKK